MNDGLCEVSFPERIFTNDEQKKMIKETERANGAVQTYDEKIKYYRGKNMRIYNNNKPTKNSKG